jgi:hypothetical protein
MFFNEKGEIKDDYNELNLFDTDVRELESEAVNERYLEFKVTKPTLVGGVLLTRLLVRQKKARLQK